MVIGEDDRKATPDEIESMQKMVSSLMDQGIFGVSTGLIYPPNAFANVDEPSEVSKAAAAKGGLYAAMKVFAKELVSEGIRLNMVSPGPIDTPLLYRNPGMSDAEVAHLKDLMINAVPMHRMGEADEVARAVLFLASDEASFITGIQLPVDGGWLTR